MSLAPTHPTGQAGFIPGEQALRRARTARAEAGAMRRFAEACRDPGCTQFGAAVDLTETRAGFLGQSHADPWPPRILQLVKDEMTLELKDIILRAADKAEQRADQLRTEARDQAARSARDEHKQARRRRLDEQEAALVARASTDPGPDATRDLDAATRAAHVEHDASPPHPQESDDV